MKVSLSASVTRAGIFSFVVATSAALPNPTASGLQEGATFELNGRVAVVTKLETLPYVESEYTRRFRFDSYDNAKLKQLRERYRLDDVVSGGKDEFDRQVLLMNWTHHQFKKFGAPSTNATSALDILQAISEGHTFFCSHYAHVFVSAAASLGWVDRELALRRHQGVAKVGGSTEHSSTEIWSNQHRKWVMLDPTGNMYVETNGVPLNAFEIRQEWFYRGGTNLNLVIGSERRRYRKADLPVFLEKFAGFGDLAVHPDELDKYGFTAYIPNTDFMDAREDYANMFIVKDKLCDGTRWHVRTVPANPAVDPYFPLGQVAMSLAAERGRILATFKTMTPNFERYEMRVDGTQWTQCGERVTWEPRPGENRLEVRTVNRFGVPGPVSAAVVTVLQPAL